MNYFYIFTWDTSEMLPIGLYPNIQQVGFEQQQGLLPNGYILNQELLLVWKQTIARCPSPHAFYGLNMADGLLYFMGEFVDSAQAEEDWQLKNPDIDFVHILDGEVALKVLETPQDVAQRR